MASTVNLRLIDRGPASVRYRTRPVAGTALILAQHVLGGSLEGLVRAGEQGRQGDRGQSAGRDSQAFGLAAQFLGLGGRELESNFHAFTVTRSDAVQQALVSRVAQTRHTTPRLRAPRSGSGVARLLQHFDLPVFLNLVDVAARPYILRHRGLPG